jgi:hypothetical protein
MTTLSLSLSLLLPLLLPPLPMSHPPPSPSGFLGSLIPLLEENLPRVWTSVAGSALAEPVSGVLV